MTAKLQLTHALGHSVALSAPGAERPLWTYVYSGKPKPFFHPVCTPAGHCLTLFEPHDHFWHRGLWFTIKFINGENFWEEYGDFGSQRTLLPPAIAHGPDGRITLESLLDWVRPGREEAVFRERRQIAFQPLGGDAYALDFATALLAQADLALDRTPFTTWGGYGGLTFRGSRNWQETKLLFSDGSTSDRPIGKPALWCDLAGKLDGGQGQAGGVAIFDHPDNLRHPSPWYGSTGPGHYFNAAFLFHEPLGLAAGEELRFRYRVLVHDGVWDVERLQAAYDSYCAAE
ncbi:MAG TPA: PmoA family protein [Roseiflexaceae bacterium]|nr:PmoA family protein [Roseiflexaceae bacterium]